MCYFADNFLHLELEDKALGYHMEVEDLSHAFFFEE